MLRIIYLSYGQREYTSSYAEAEVRNVVVADCKASVLKYVPLGAYPEGTRQVIAALNYCGTLG